MARIKVDLRVQKYKRSFRMTSSERFHERGEDLVGTNHESVFRSFASRYKPDVVLYVYKLGTGGFKWRSWQLGLKR